jgi:hypothetical protein
MTLRDVLQRMERMRAVGVRRTCPDCDGYVRFVAPEQAAFEQLQLDIEIALRREREAAEGTTR